MSLTIVQVLPALEVGGVEQGTVELAAELVRQGHRSIVVSRPGRMLPALLGAGSEHLAWPVGDKRLGTLRYVRTLRRLLIDARVDVLHARSRLPGWIAYWAWRGLPRARRPSFVTTVHGPYTVNPYSAVMMRGERVIAISDYIRDYIRDNYPHAADRVELIHRGVAAERYPYGYRPPKEWLQQWYRDFPQTEDRYLVTLPARITRWKGQAEFIDVLRRLSAADIPVHGLLAGAAEPRQAKFLAELEQRIDAHGLNARVSLLGQRADLREVLALSRCGLVFGERTRGVRPDHSGGVAHGSPRRRLRSWRHTRRCSAKCSQPAPAHPAILTPWCRKFRSFTDIRQTYRPLRRFHYNGCWIKRSRCIRHCASSRNRTYGAAAKRIHPPEIPGPRPPNHSSTLRSSSETSPSGRAGS